MAVVGGVKTRDLDRDRIKGGVLWERKRTFFRNFERAKEAKTGSDMPQDQAECECVCACLAYFPEECVCCLRGGFWARVKNSFMS